MFAYIKPLSEETLIIEIDMSEALDLHGSIVSGGRTREFPNQLLSILEAFHAGTDMSHFAPDDDEETTPFEDDKISTLSVVNKPTFRNHGEEIDYTLKNHKEES